MTKLIFNIWNHGKYITEDSEKTENTEVIPNYETKFGVANSE